MSKNEQLTDRYIYAVSRDMPEATRADIATELRSTIADTIEDHVANGADPAQAEREVLTSLGSPTAFATRYATGPTQLIGPRYYFVWKRVTFNVLIWVVPIISVIAALAEALDENSMTNVVTTLLGTAFSVALHVAFWTTLSFAIVDRVTHNDASDQWTLDELPVLPVETALSKGDAIGGAIFSLVMAALLVLQAQFVWIRSSEPVPVLSLDLWSFWLPLLIAVCIASAVLEIWKYRSGWTIGTAASAVILSLVLTVSLVYLARTEQLLSAVFIEKDGMGSEGLTITMNIVIVVAIAVARWEIGEALVGLISKGRPQVPTGVNA